MKFLLILCSVVVSGTAFGGAEPKAVATFESIGLAWAPPADPGPEGCPVRFRKAGDDAWRAGLPLWYDARDGECRGSLVHLSPGTRYEITIGREKEGTRLFASTWKESFPVARTVDLGDRSGQVDIREGGAPDGYVVYTGGTLDAGNEANHNLTIAAPYVIVRGLVLKGAKIDAIRLLPGAHDVVIEGNDISEWGRFRIRNRHGWDLGVDMDSGIRAVCRGKNEVERIVIQDNRIHHPRWGANSWSFGHPSGPQAITFSHCGGNHVIRHNEIYSSEGRYFNDAIGGEDNFSSVGFPNRDTDIYGNRISHAWDDAIEAEGANRNVRIWGNHLDLTGTGIATTATHEGPVYIFRNVYARSRLLSERDPDADDRGPFAKAGSTAHWGNGRRYVFHNTLVQPPGKRFSSGAGTGIAGNSRQPLTNTVSRNNAWLLWKTHWPAIVEANGRGNDFDYDLSNGKLAQPHGVRGSELRDGRDRGARLPNFNDDYAGRAPDIGAEEDGRSRLKFGLRGEGRPAATRLTATKQ